MQLTPYHSACASLSLSPPYNPEQRQLNSQLQS